MNNINRQGKMVKISEAEKKIIKNYRDALMKYFNESTNNIIADKEMMTGPKYLIRK